MSRRKKIVLNKLYNSRFESYQAERVLIVCGVVTLICALLLYYVFDSEDLADILGAFSLAFWYASVLFFLSKLADGYMIQDDAIVFRYRFMKRKLLYKDIKCIIISNVLLKGITKTPHITVIGGEQDKILQYCLNAPKRHVLTDIDIKYRLGEEIGYYYPDNFWKKFKKGSSVIYNCGFWWNKREMHKIFSGFPGIYYVAASVLENYHDEFDDIVKKYGISSERICIMDDSTNGEFIWTQFSSF